MAKIISLPNIGIILNLIFGRSHSAHWAVTLSHYYHFIAWAGTKPYHDIGTATVATPLWRCAKTSRLNPLHICRLQAYLFTHELVPARLILKTFNNNWYLGAVMFVERLVLFTELSCAFQIPLEKVMSVTTVYQTTCRFCESIEAGIMLSLAFIADFFAVARVATKASNVAMSGDYEEAKRIIETL